MTWLESAADLLAEPDPGPVPWLVEDLIVDRAVTLVLGAPKTGKTWALLELAVAIVTGRPAFGRLDVSNPGPVMIVLEESGRDALYRRLDALRRGTDDVIGAGELRGLHFAANQRVRLDDPAWQLRLREAAAELRPRAIFLDPLARLKAAGRDENEQSAMAPVLEFMRDLREASGAAVVFAHHTGHVGDHARGSSDIESFWESKLRLTRDDGTIRLASEHREAESGFEIRYRLDWDAASSSIRLAPVDSALVEKVRAILAARPEETANRIHAELGGRKKDVLEAVKRVRAEVVPDFGNHREPPLFCTPGGRFPEGGTPPLRGGAPREPVPECRFPESGTGPSDEPRGAAWEPDS